MIITKGFSDTPIYMTPPCGADRIEAAMRAGELGMITTPAQGNRLVDGAAWCHDNGVFGGNYPGNEAYLAGLAALAEHADTCLFVVAPDEVGNHWATKALATEDFSLPGEDPEDARNMLVRIRELGFPVAFVAQPGIEFDAWDFSEDIDCLFIGGGDDWKESAAVAELVTLANGLGIWTHMGRVNTLERYRIAADMGCDSVDGTCLTFAPDANLGRVLGWSVTVRAELAAALQATTVIEVEARVFAEVNGWNPDRPRQRGKFTSRRPAPAAEVEADQMALFAA